MLLPAASEVTHKCFRNPKQPVSSDSRRCNKKRHEVAENQH